MQTTFKSKALAGVYTCDQCQVLTRAHPLLTTAAKRLKSLKSELTTE